MGPLYNAVEVITCGWLEKKGECGLSFFHLPKIEYLLVPFLLPIVTMVVRVLSRRVRGTKWFQVEPEDWNVGFDLLLAALAASILFHASLSAGRGHHGGPTDEKEKSASAAQESDKRTVETRRAELLKVIMSAVIFLPLATVAVRLWGWDLNHLGKYELNMLGIWCPIAFGFLSFAGLIVTV